MARLHAWITSSPGFAALAIRRGWRLVSVLFLYLTLPFFPRRIMRFMRLFRRNLEYYRGRMMPGFIRRNVIFPDLTYVLFHDPPYDGDDADSDAGPDTVDGWIDWTPRDQRPADLIPPPWSGFLP